MRTDFTDAQLKDPATADAAAAIRACVHCGMCNATCPTYLVTGDERDGPRGRIQIMQAMLEKGGPPSDVAVRHVDRCLSCLACRTTCPSSVNYAHLVDRARTHIAEHYVRPRDERWFRAFLARVLPYPSRFRLAMRLAPLSKMLGRMLPGPFRRTAELVPEMPPDGEAPSVGIYPAEGVRKMRVAMLRGCVQRVLTPEIDRAAIRLLNRLGAEVIVPAGSGCCGALNHHLGADASARRFARANIGAWWKVHETGGVDRIVVTASGCGTQVKDYDHLLRGDAGFVFRTRKLVPLVRDVVELAEELGFQGRAPEPLRVAVQAACSLQHGQKLSGLGERMLTAAGFTLTPVADTHLCCGSAGHYSLLQPEMAGTLRTRKLECLEAGAPHVIASGNMGCMEHLRRGAVTPIVHTAELLDWASGGPKPTRLEAFAMNSPRG